MAWVQMVYEQKLAISFQRLFKALLGGRGLSGSVALPVFGLVELQDGTPFIVVVSCRANT